MFKKILYILFALFFFAPQINAQNVDMHSSNWAQTDYGSVRLVSGVSSIGKSAKIPLGVEFKLPTGWKIYHKDSGDAGLPPELIDLGSKNVIFSELLFPKPIQFTFLGIKTNGYKEAVVFPCDITVKDPNVPVTIKVEVNYLSCKEICVPVSSTVSLTLKTGASVATSHFQNIAKYRATVGQLADSSFATGANGNASPSLIWIFVIAFIGGLILNVMPCVLPVLSLKTIGILQSLDRGRSAMRWELLFMAMGVISTFVIMATVLSILKLAGWQLGWGIQFQQPVFLSIMMVTMIVFSANILGAFYINPPAVGRGIFWAHSYRAKAFYNGVLATVLATPCSAPFLGTAVGFALGGKISDIYFVFMTLGLGMALPYILLGLVPAWAKYMPKSGPWMVTVKNVMGAFMALTAVYLGWILSLSIGLEKVFVTAVIGIVIVVLLSVSYKSKLYKMRYILSVVLAFSAFTLSTGATEKTQEKANGVWQKFEINKIDSLVESGKIVFVDVTASWCVTCKVNKAVALDTDDVISALSEDSVVAMLADWTHPSKVISDYLQSYGRFGIPFNIVYSKNYPEGIVLPELLSKTVVLESIEKSKQ